MCDSRHHYTVEGETQQTAFYTGTDRGSAISVHVAHRRQGRCGYITAGHPGGEESNLTEDEASKTPGTSR